MELPFCAEPRSVVAENTATIKIAIKTFFIVPFPFEVPRRVEEWLMEDKHR